MASKKTVKWAYRIVHHDGHCGGEECWELYRGREEDGSYVEEVRCSRRWANLNDEASWYPVEFSSKKAALKAKKYWETKEPK